MRRPVLVPLCLLFVAPLLACTGIPKDALQLSPESLELRQLQTRRFETNDEARILSACAGLLQDLGFTLDESETALGLIVASKDRSAVEVGQVVAAVFIAALTGAAVPVDETQKLRASIVSRPVGENNQSTAVRVTFQRIVWNTHGQISKQEGLNEAEMYQEFFEKLSKSLFLEAHQI